MKVSENILKFFSHFQYKLVLIILCLSLRLSEITPLNFSPGKKELFAMSIELRWLQVVARTQSATRPTQSISIYNVELTGYDEAERHMLAVSQVGDDASVVAGMLLPHCLDAQC